MTSINGIGGGLSGLGHPGLDRRAPAEEAARRDADAQVDTTAARASQAAAAAAESPAAGVDPDLWAMLTSDERAFYLKNAMNGPLTYGPGASSMSAAPESRLGGRIDVRG